MEVVIGSTFHNTKATIYYSGGMYTIPDSVLDKLCPNAECFCLGTPAGFPKILSGPGLQVDLNEDNDFVLKPE